MRLIDANALLEKLDALSELFRRRGENEDKGFLAVQCGVMFAAEEVNDAPTVDAVEVVRCGECANRNTCGCPLAYAVESGIGNDLPGDDDFCSYGERMDADAPERAEGGGA